MLDAVIVGGGVHGVHLAVVLRSAGVAAADRLMLLDPHDTLLARWRHCTRNVGMRSLRSPGVHHLDVDPMSLIRFAAARGRSAELFAPYDRPSLALFRDHCDHVLERFALQERHQRCQVTRIDPQQDGVRVHTSGGDLLAKRVILAVGGGDTLHFPAWARRMMIEDTSAPVHHVYDEGFRLDALQIGQGVAVVGGGIGAVQAALHLAARAPGRVYLFMRHEVRAHWFDSDPGWLGPKEMRAYLATSTWSGRREVIQRARHRGSVPPDLKRALEREVLSGRIALRTEAVRAARSVPDGVLLEGAHGMWAGSAVVLGTGLSPVVPGGAITQHLIEAHGARTAPCGYPAVGRGLQWLPGVFVAGGLAELELGPVARNIAGARRAAERLRAA